MTNSVVTDLRVLPEGYRTDYWREYFRDREYRRRRHERWKTRVESRRPKLTCQDCGGAGGRVEYVSSEIGGPWEECGWCEGVGLVDGHRRAEWLRWRRRFGSAA